MALDGSKRIDTVRRPDPRMRALLGSSWNEGETNPVRSWHCGAVLVDQPTSSRIRLPLPPMPPTFARSQIESILLEAARLDETRGESASVTLPSVEGDGLTLADVERAAAEVGISRAAVSAAALRVAIRTAAATPRLHAVYEIAGSLSPDALERLADEVRTRIPGLRVRSTGDGIDVASGKDDGQPGSLLVKIRSKGDGTTLSVWSAAPVLSRGDLAAVAAIGAPAALFPVVASAGGVWPALASSLALGAAGVAGVMGLAAATNRRRIARWHERAAEAVVTIAACAGALAAERVATPVVDQPRELGEG